MTHRVLFSSFLSLLVLLAVVASTGPAASQEEEILWGPWSGDLGDTLKPLHPATVLCVWSQGPVHLGHPDDDHPGYAFSPMDQPHCRMVMGGFPLEVEEATGEVHVLAARFPPRVLERPGVTPMGEAGYAVLASGVSPDAEVTVAPGGEGFDAEALSWPTLRPLVMDRDAGQWRVEASPGQDVLVVVGAQGQQQALLRWADPGWFPVAPNLGQVLAPVALALLVSLFRSGAGGSWIPAGKKKQMGDPEEADGEPDK